MSLIEEELPCEKGLGGAGEDTEIPQSYNASLASALLLQLASPGLLTLCWKTGHVGLKLSKLYLPGCMLLTFGCVSITQMPQILSLQD